MAWLLIVLRLNQASMQVNARVTRFRAGSNPGGWWCSGWGRLRSGGGEPGQDGQVGMQLDSLKMPDPQG